MASDDTPYRAPNLPTTLAALADRGRSIRAAHGDRHAMVAPTDISDPIATATERVAAKFDEAGDRLGGGVAVYFAMGAFRYVQSWVIYLVMLVASAALLAGTVVIGASVTEVLFVALGVAVAVGLWTLWRRGQPRRWLSQTPLRVDGYLELLGREHRVVRARVLVAFADGAVPDLELFKDIVTGADVPSRGIAIARPGVVEVHSVEIAGKRPVLHGWFQSFCDRVVLPMSDVWPVRLVSFEER